MNELDRWICTLGSIWQSDMRSRRPRGARRSFVPTAVLDEGPTAATDAAIPINSQTCGFDSYDCPQLILCRPMG